jgi:hypothetical protein
MKINNYNDRLAAIPDSVRNEVKAEFDAKDKIQSELDKSEPVAKSVDERIADFEAEVSEVYKSGGKF